MNHMKILTCVFVTIEGYSLDHLVLIASLVTVLYTI